MAAAVPAAAQVEQASFEQRIVTVLKTGGTVDAVEGRLNRLASGPGLTADQRVSVDAMRALVRAKTKPRGPSLAEAQAFAAAHQGSPAASILLAEAALANDLPQRSADTLSAAAARAGGLVDLVSPATVSDLTDELDKLSDKRRTVELARALLTAGWSRGSPTLRSYLAMEVVRDELAQSRADVAKRLLPVVTSPASLHSILIDNRLAALRPNVERLAGPRLEKQWRTYLAAARDEWLRTGDYVAATAYVDALRQANQHQAVVDGFFSRFMRGYNCPTDLVSRTVARDLADSLGKLGRWTKAGEVMARSGGVSTATYAAMLLEKGEFGQAATYFDRALKGARQARNKDDEKGIAWLKAARDCAVYGDRKITGGGYDAKLLDLPARLSMALCLDRQAEAREMLIAAFADQEERGEALRWVQPAIDPPATSLFRREMSARIRQLQGDPAVVAAASRHGVILDWALAASAPTDLAVGTSRSVSWRCGEDSWRRDALDQEKPQPPPPGMVMSE